MYEPAIAGPMCVAYFELHGGCPMKIRISTLLLAIAAWMVVARPANAQVSNWTLSWSNVYTGTAGVFTPTSSNNSYWTFDTGKGVFGTGEIEDMISDGTTSYLDGSGHLVIKTYDTSGTYYSARFKTQGERELRPRLHLRSSRKQHADCHDRGPVARVLDAGR